MVCAFAFVRHLECQSVATLGYGKIGNLHIAIECSASSRRATLRHVHKSDGGGQSERLRRLVSVARGMARINERKGSALGRPMDVKL